MAVPAQLEIWERRESVHLPHRSRIGERVGLSLGVPLPFFRKIQKIIDLALQKAETSSTLGDAEGKPLNWVLPLAGEDIGNCAGNLNPVARMPTPSRNLPVIFQKAAASEILAECILDRGQGRTSIIMVRLANC